MSFPVPLGCVLARCCNIYCKYLTLEIKHSRNKQEDSELDKCTEELSHLFQNPCIHLPVRPLHYEEALTATGIAQYVPSRQDLTPYRTPHLCQSLAGNSFHPKLVIATLGGDSNVRNHIRSAQFEPSTDNSQVLPPMQVQEHFATKILAPLTENPSTKKQLQEAWKTNEERMRTLNPYRHLKIPPRSNGEQHPQPPFDISSIQYGLPDDHVRLYRQATQRNAAEDMLIMSAASSSLVLWWPVILLCSSSCLLSMSFCFSRFFGGIARPHIFSVLR